jgi:hypothetical protein
MIVIDFIADDSVIERDLAEGGSPDAIEEAAWFETWFEVPVRFAVDNIDLLEGPRVGPEEAIVGAGWTTVPRLDDPRYTRLPIVGFAVDLSRMLAALEAGSEDRWRPGALRFRRERVGKVRVTSVRLGREVIVTEEELHDAAAMFIERVKEFLSRRASGIDRHPRWNEWFPGVAGGRTGRP